MRLIAILCTLSVLLAGCGRGTFPVFGEFQEGRSDSQFKQESESLRSLSFNIYFEDGPQNNSWWYHRRPLTIQMLEDFDPQLIAFQELRYSLDVPYDSQQQWMFKMVDLQAAFPDRYEVVPETRPSVNHAGIYGDYIFYDSSRLKPIGYEVTPVVDPITGENILCPAGIYAFERYITWVWFFDSALGKTFHVFNVHLCVSNQHVRKVHAIELMEKIAAINNNEDVYVFGDFNTTEGSSIYRYIVGTGMLDDGRGERYAPTALVDSFREMYPAATSVGTNNAFSEQNHYGADGRRIDYIFTRNANITEARIDNTRVKVPSRSGNATFPSDHYGVFVETRKGFSSTNRN